MQKNYENRSIFSKDMDKSIVSPFLTHGANQLQCGLFTSEAPKQLL